MEWSVLPRSPEHRPRARPLCSRASSSSICVHSRVSDRTERASSRTIFSRSTRRFTHSETPSGRWAPAARLRVARARVCVCLSSYAVLLHSVTSNSREGNTCTQDGQARPRGLRRRTAIGSSHPVRQFHFGSRSSGTPETERDRDTQPRAPARARVLYQPPETQRSQAHREPVIVRLAIPSGARWKEIFFIYFNFFKLKIKLK